MARYIAILEDDDERIREMRERISDRFPYRTKVFRTAANAIGWLYCHADKVALLSLDHDLEPSELGDEDPGTGRDVVAFLKDLSPCFPIIVHSSNGDAAFGMQQELLESDLIVERVIPHDGTAWIGQDWFRLVRSMLIANSATKRDEDRPSLFTLREKTVERLRSSRRIESRARELKSRWARAARDSSGRRNWRRGSVARLRRSVR